MSIVGKNIRKIRSVKKLSQASFAEIFSLARPSVGAYEEERAEPKLDTVIQIAKHFGISVDSLVTKELTINDLYNFNVHMEHDLKPGTLVEKKKDISESFIKTVFVPEDKQLEYIVNIKNRDFFAKLPKILLPRQHDKNIRAFEMNADDMHDNFHGLNIGDLVFGKKMKTPLKFSNNRLYILVCNKKVYIRRVFDKKDHLELRPDNSNFSTTDMAKGEIIESWEVFGYFSTKIEAPTLVSERIMHLENLVDVMNTRLTKLEKA